MTTNQQIDKIIASLYNYQVKQKMEWIQMPNYDALCEDLFADMPNSSERHFLNLLYILTSKRLINTYAVSPDLAYHQPITLRPEVIEWYEQFHSYIDYLDYLQEKNQPKAFREDYNEDIDAEETGRKSIWSKMPVWAKILLLIIIIGAVFVIVTGISKE